MQDLGGGRYLGGVEVHVIILLVSGQILMFMVSGRSYHHHPVAVFLTAGVEAHHHAVLLEDLSRQDYKGRKFKLKATFTHTKASRALRAPSKGTLLPSPGGEPSSLQRAQTGSS